MWRRCLVAHFILIVLAFISSIVFAQGTWVPKANPLFTARGGAVGFSIANKGYLGTGWQYSNNIFYNDFWEWDQLTNAWSQKADFPGTKRGDAVGFSIGAKGYMGTGRDSSVNSPFDFWEWDQATNSWAPKANFIGGGRAFATGFSIGNKGYFGTATGVNPADFWEWNQVTNTWLQRSDFGGGYRAFAIGLSVDNKGYVGLGLYNGTDHNDFWEFDPATNSWTQKANFPGAPRSRAASFSIGTKAYVGTGSDISGAVFSDFWEWDQLTNTWARKADYPHPVTDIDHGTFSIGCHGYFGCGSGSPTGGPFFDDFWEYTPDYAAAIVPTISAHSTICAGSSITLSSSGGTYYYWSTGDTLSSINVSPTVTTTYSVAIYTDCAYSEAYTTVTVINSATSSFTYEYDPCKTKCLSFINNSNSAITSVWDFGDGQTSYARSECHRYKDSSIYRVLLTINKGTNCADTFSLQVPYVDHDTSAFVYIPNAFSPNDDGSNDVLHFFRKDNFCLKEFYISIHNRWGEKVFETNNIDNAWNGLFNNEPLDASVYTYYCRAVTITGIQQMRKGNVSLIR